MSVRKQHRQQRIFRLLQLGLGFGMMGMLACSSNYGSGSTNAVTLTSLGAFDCVDRVATATPPPREVLSLGMIRGDEKQIDFKRPKPLVNFTLCGAGKVPAARTIAKSNVPKGNPLLGRIDGDNRRFFDDKEVGYDIRKALRDPEKVYFIPPGRDDKPHGKPDDPPGCNGTLSFGTCYYYGPASYRRTADGGGMTMRIQRPTVVNSGHSLDELAVQGGTDDGNIIELGWNVSNTQYGDTNTHLFVFHWMNWTPTCYDACNWHQYSATYFPGMNLNALVGRDVYIGYVFYGGNWWAWFDNQWLGYYPGSEWSGGYTRSEYIQWFGEVSTDNGLPPNTQMGNGLFPTNAGAAPNVTLCDVDAAAWVCWYRDLQSLGPNYPPYYDVRRTGFGAVRFGGPGH